MYSDLKRLFERKYNFRQTKIYRFFLQLWKKSKKKKSLNQLLGNVITTNRDYIDVLLLLLTDIFQKYMYMKKKISRKTTFKNLLFYVLFVPVYRTYSKRLES